MARQQLGLADGGRLEHNYYEQGHGKNQSDRLGAVGKQAYLRGMAGKNHGETPTTMEDIARIMRDNLPCQGKETSVTRVVVLPPLDPQTGRRARSLSRGSGPSTGSAGSRTAGSSALHSAARPASPSRSAIAAAKCFASVHPRSWSLR